MPKRMRSSGTWEMPRALTTRAEALVMGAPSSTTEPRVERRSPVMASTSSRCPLPDTPAIPRISPCRTARETPFTASYPRSLSTARSRTSSTTGPGAISLRSRLNSTSRPTIRRASSRRSTCRGSAPPSSFPRRSTTTRVQIACTSSSLWEMKITECPSAAMRRTTANSSSASGGVSTEVGSSSTSRSAPCSRVFTISTFCCSPAESCHTLRAGSRVRP